MTTPPPNDERDLKADLQRFGLALLLLVLAGWIVSGMCSRRARDERPSIAPDPAARPR
jgi:hypothetical protein